MDSREREWVQVGRKCSLLVLVGRGRVTTICRLMSLCSRLCVISKQDRGSQVSRKLLVFVARGVNEIPSVSEELEKSWPLFA